LTELRSKGFWHYVYYLFNSNLIVVTFENRTLDVPYGDHFYHAERWFIACSSPNSQKV